MTAIVQWLWQGLVVAALACVALRVLPRVDAATRHAILWVAVTTVLVLPLSWRPAAAGLPLASAPLAPPAFGAVVLPAVPAWILGAVAGAWLGWVVLGTARLVVGWRWLHRWRERAVPLPSDVREALSPWLQHVDGGPLPQIRVSRAIGGACAIGFGTPTILVSADLLETLDPGALAQVVLHEQAHLHRGDHWGRLVESLVHVVAGPHPAVAVLLRRLDLEREAACDDFVVARTGSPQDYARSLVEAATVEARARTTRRLPALAPGASGWRGGLATRVERLLDGPRPARHVAYRPAVAASLVGAALALAGAGTLAPAGGFADPPPPRPLAALRARPPRQPPSSGFRVQAPTDNEVAVVPPVAARSATPAGTTRSAVVPTPPLAGPEDDARVDAAVVLEGRSLGHGMTMRPSSPAGQDDVVAVPSSPWMGMVTAGRAVGQAGERGGAAIGDAAARDGSAVARGARRAGGSVATFFSKPF